MTNTNLPLRLQTQHHDVQVLLDLLSTQQDSLWQDNVLFEHIPNIKNYFQAIIDDVLEWAEDLDVVEEVQSDYSRRELWEKLLAFASSFRNIYQNSTEWQQDHDWTVFRIRDGQTWLDFFQDFFDKIQSDVSTDFKTMFESLTGYDISEYQNKFEEWKKLGSNPDWDVYMDKVRNMSRLIHMMKWTLRLAWLTRFEIKANLWSNEGQEDE